MPADRPDFDWIGPVLSAHAERHDLDVATIVSQVLTQVDAPASDDPHPVSPKVQPVRVRCRWERWNVLPDSWPERPRRPLSAVALAAACVVLLAIAASALPRLANWSRDARSAGSVQLQSPRPTTGSSVSPVPTVRLGPNPTSTSTGRTPSGPTGTTSKSGLPSVLQWRSTGPLIAPRPDPAHPVTGVKDPTAVYHGGRWHVFATVVSPFGYSLEYLSFTDWSQAGSATPYYLDQSGLGAGYRAAPQVFYFAPQKLWYLVFQTGNASYSTNPDIANPAGWSAPRNFYSGTPAIIAQNLGPGFWVDMWVICDSSTCYLFSSDENGHLYRSQTSLAAFPNGMSQPVVALQETDPNRLHEAGNVFAIAGTNRYLLLGEALGADGRRYSRSWTATRPTGPWTPLADSQARPFAGAGTVTFTGPPWTLDISHGEPLRAGADQTMPVDPCRLRYVYDGHDPTASGSQETLPWQLGLLTQTNSTCRSGSPASSPG